MRVNEPRYYYFLDRKRPRIRRTSLRNQMKPPCLQLDSLASPSSREDGLASESSLQPRSNDSVLLLELVS